jgi:protoporphyrin/coproporphyrin ferrochelatase
MKTKAILLVNLGSPNSCEVSDVKTYLNEFLMDERVIDIKNPWRTLLVKGIIVPFRAAKSAAKYKTIWTDKGSPLIQITKELTAAVQQQSGLPTYMCMRYANPTPEVVLKQMQKDLPDLKEVVMMPLYPHYAMSSYESAMEHVLAAHKKNNFLFSIKTVAPFYNHPQYIEALSESIKPYLQKNFDHLLFSYHGIPERHIRKSDTTQSHCLSCENCCDLESKAHAHCYRYQVFETTKLVTEKLGLPKDKFSVSFQSRLNEKWLKPFTDKVLESFPKQGLKKMVVVSPAFVSDCLETLEEIEVEAKETFMHHGGEEYTAIPCMNTQPLWVKTVCELVNQTF